jgi:hypothetical protein
MFPCSNLSNNSRESAIDERFFLNLPRKVKLELSRSQTAMNFGAMPTLLYRSLSGSLVRSPKKQNIGCVVGGQLTLNPYNYVTHFYSSHCSIPRGFLVFVRENRVKYVDGDDQAIAPFRLFGNRLDCSEFVQE